MLEGSISFQLPTSGRSPGSHRSTLPPSIRTDEAQEGPVPGRECLGVTARGLNVGQAVLVIRDCMLECAKLNPGMSTPEEPGKLPGLTEAEGVGLARRHLDAWAYTPLGKVPVASGDTPPGLKTSCAVEQAQGVPKLRGGGWRGDPSKEKARKQTLLSGMTASKGGALRSNPQSESIRILNRLWCRMHLLGLQAPRRRGGEGDEGEELSLSICCGSGQQET